MRRRDDRVGTSAAGASETTGAYNDPVTAEPRRSWSAFIWTWLAVALAVGFGIGWGVNAWVSGGGNSAQPNAGITINDLTSNPSAFYGDQVVVSGQITGFLSNNGVLGTNASIGGNSASGNSSSGSNGQPGGFVLSNNVVVVGQNLPNMTELQQNQSIANGDVVQVVGTVHKYNVNDINSNYGFGWTNSTFGGNGPAIYASKINLVPTIPLNQKVNVSATVNQIANGGASTYRSINVTVTGTPNQRLSDHSFTFTSNSGNVLVVTPNSTLPQSFNGQVTVHGVVTEPSTAVLKTQLNVQNNSNLNTYLGIGANQNANNALSNYSAAIIANSVTMGGSSSASASSGGSSASSGASMSSGASSASSSG